MTDDKKPKKPAPAASVENVDAPSSEESAAVARLGGSSDESQAVARLGEGGPSEESQAVARLGDELPLVETSRIETLQGPTETARYAGIIPTDSAKVEVPVEAAETKPIEARLLASTPVTVKHIDTKPIEARPVASQLVLEIEAGEPTGAVKANGTAAEKPGADEGVTRPTAGQSTDGPGVTQPSTGQSTAEPGVTQPTAGQSTAEPGVTQPSAGQSRSKAESKAREPGVTRPTAGQSTAEPGVTQPSAGQSRSEGEDKPRDPGVTQPSTGQSHEKRATSAPELEGLAPDFALAEESLPPLPAGEAASTAPPPPQVPLPPILPSPQEAALEAARIVSQMVDIDSESGAVIAAAAAAGAAIEASLAAQKQAAQSATGEPDPRASNPAMRVPAASELAAIGATNDPTTTVRLSRDRILQALANEDIGVAIPAGRESTPRIPGTDPAAGRIRARTEPGVDGEEEIYEEFDPVAIAAAAIGRLRQRARTDLAELRVHYHRHDILVLLLAFVIIVIAGQIHERLVTPPNEAFSARGLTFSHSTAWLRPEPLPMTAPRIVRDTTGAAPTQDENLYHVELAAVGSTARLEVLIDKKPTWSNIVTGLDLDRRSRWGELYSLDASSVRSIAGHDWLRTAYHYASVPEKNDQPRIGEAVEYATIDREQIYVITIFGTNEEIAQTEDVVSPTLRVPSQTGLPLVPQTSRLSQRKFPSAVKRAFDSTVMVVVADLVDGRLKARGGGSGVVVGAEGSILTNYHVLHDKDGRLHDAFVIGRFANGDQAPQLQCAGRPSRSKLLRDLDLALIKCDMDLDGRTWQPANGGIWPTLLEARTADIKMGQRLWVLGYPDVGGGGLTASTGEIEGYTGEDGTAGKDFIKTDASITHGNSGGPVIDDSGRLVGIAAAFRTRMTANGGIIETAQVGLVRPIGAASNLLAYAAAGWTPREGYNDVELTPTAVEASAEGIRIYTTVVDDSNDAPIRDATVMVLKAGVNTSTIDMNRLDDQAIAWGKTNSLGEVRLKQLVPIPGTYTVMVIAPGYEPLIGESELRLDDKTPPSFDPWGKIGLRSR
ncbi:MAG: trypsin-like serine protease [Kofleriaceae bacterium]|nr:trypsin-like serine protease [Kofleriaceae bacterium]